MVGGGLPDQRQEDGLAALAGQHVTVAPGVLRAHVVDCPHGPQLYRLLLQIFSTGTIIFFHPGS